MQIFFSSKIGIFENAFLALRAGMVDHVFLALWAGMVDHVFLALWAGIVDRYGDTYKKFYVVAPSTACTIMPFVSRMAKNIEFSRFGLLELTTYFFFQTALYQ